MRGVLRCVSGCRLSVNTLLLATIPVTGQHPLFCIACIIEIYKQNVLSPRDVVRMSRRVDMIIGGMFCRGVACSVWCIL